jgi:hypothetical protein
MTTEIADDVGFDEPAVDTTPTAVDTRNSEVITKDLTRVQSAMCEFDRVSAGLAELETLYPKDAVYEVSTTAGMKAAIEHRAAYRDPRVMVEKARKMAKAPILALGKNIDARASWITERLEAGELPVHEQIKAEEQRKEDERQARINAEAGRVLAIQEALAEIAQDVMVASGKTSADIQTLLDQMRTTSPDPLVFQEMVEQARAAWSAGIAKLETAYKAKLYDEEQARQRAAAEAEEKRQRAEADAERARVAAAQKVEADRLAAERAEFERERAAFAAAQEAARKAAEPPPAPIPAPAPAPIPEPVAPVPAVAEAPTPEAALLRAILNCPHTIDDKKVVLKFDPSLPGHNALNQLSLRLRAEVAA